MVTKALIFVEDENEILYELRHYLVAAVHIHLSGLLIVTILLQEFISTCPDSTIVTLV